MFWLKNGKSDLGDMREIQKICQACGRVIQWRRKWEKCWDEVKYCSRACRGSKRSDTDLEIERVIVRLLQDRAVGATICPSEAARVVFSEESWRLEMQRVRKAARRLVDQGLILICQRAKVIDPSSAKGPIRLKLTSKRGFL